MFCHASSSEQMPQSVLEKMAATGNESNDLSLSESTDFGGNDKTSD